MLFLEGKQESLLTRLQQEMSDASLPFPFQSGRAPAHRIVQVRRVTEGRRVIWKSRLDMDLMAIARARGQACVEVFLVRGGKLIGQEFFVLDGVHDQPDAVVMGAFLKQFYTARTASARLGPVVSGDAHLARDNQSPVPVKARSRAASTSAAAVPKEILGRGVTRRPGRTSKRG